MLLPASPRTTAERQADFQARHPGYDRRRKARQRAKHTSATCVAQPNALMAQIESTLAGTPEAAPAEAGPAADSAQLLLFPIPRPAA